MTAMRPNIPPTPEDHIARCIAAHRKRPRRERAKDHKAAMHQRLRREQWEARMQKLADDKYARRAFKRFLKEMFGDQRVWKPVRFRPAKHLGARRTGKSKAGSRARLHLPSVGHDIIDRKGRRGVFLSIGYDGAKGNRLGVFRRRIEYAALSAEVVRTPGGLPMLVSNVAATVDEAVAIGDEVEAFNRAERTNGKVCFNLVIGFPRGAGRREREKIMRIFTQRAFADEGLPYVGFIHEPKRAGQIHNPHGHITASLRPVYREGPYRYLISKELRVDLDGEDGMLRMRRILAEVTTKVMREAGFEHEYTHLSNAARGLALIPQKKLSKVQTEAAKRGEHVSASDHNKGLVKGARRHVFAQLKAQINASIERKRLPILASSSSPAAAVLPPLRKFVAEPLARIVRRSASPDVVRIDLSKPGESHRTLHGGKPVSANAAVIPAPMPAPAQAMGRYPLRLRCPDILSVDATSRATAPALHATMRTVQWLDIERVAIAAIFPVTSPGRKVLPLYLLQSAMAVAQAAPREVSSSRQAAQFVNLKKLERSARLFDLHPVSRGQAAEPVFIIPRAIRIADNSATPRAAPAEKRPRIIGPTRATLTPMVFLGSTKPPAMSAAVPPAPLVVMLGALPKLDLIAANVRPAITSKLIVEELVAKAGDLVVVRAPHFPDSIRMLARAKGVAHSLSIPHRTPVIEVSKLPRIEPPAKSMTSVLKALLALDSAPRMQPAASPSKPTAKMILPAYNPLAPVGLPPMTRGPDGFKAIRPQPSRSERQIERVALPLPTSKPDQAPLPSMVRAPTASAAKISVRPLPTERSPTITMPTPSSAQMLAMPITKARASMARLRDTRSAQAARHLNLMKSLREKIEAMRAGLTAGNSLEPSRMDVLKENGGAAQTARAATRAQPDIESAAAKALTSVNIPAPYTAAQAEEILRPRIFGPDGRMHMVAYNDPAAVAQRVRLSRQQWQPQQAAHAPLSVDKKDTQAAHRHAAMLAQHSRVR